MGELLMEKEITRAQIIGWIIANLGVDVRSRARRIRFQDRAVTLVGRVVDALGDNIYKVWPRMSVDLVCGGGWERDNPAFAEEIRVHIARMEKARGRSAIRQSKSIRPSYS